MTYNELIFLFKDIASKHLQIKRFGDGEEWELDEKGDMTGVMKPGFPYPVWYAIPIESTVKENTVEWSFEFLCFAQVKKDKSNENEVLSDTHTILTGLVKIFRHESDYYRLLNEPVLTQFKEKYGDFCAGNKATFMIETDFPNNYCDVPIDDLSHSERVPYGRIYDKDTGNTIAFLYPGEEYPIEILTEIRQQLGYTGASIIQVLT